MTLDEQKELITNDEGEMTEVKGGPARGLRMLLLSPAHKTNDGIERCRGRNVYLACFSYSRYEDVAMWMNYGKGNPSNAK